MCPWSERGLSSLVILRRWLLAAAYTGWMLWAYVRLLPNPPIVTAGGRLRNYHDWAYAHLAYADVLALYHTRHLYLHLMPYIHNRIEYPVLMGIVMWLASYVPGVVGYFTVTAVVLWLCGLLTYFMLEKKSPKYAYAFAASPLLLVYGLLNWDLIGIFLMVWAWSLYRDQRFVSSGLVFSLGVFFKLFPIFFLPFITVEMFRSKQVRHWIRMAVAFFAASVIINVPFMVGNFKNWAFFFTYNANRGLGADIWANRWVHGLSIGLVNSVSLGVVALAVGGLMWWVWHGGSVTAASAIAFGTFLVVNKVFSPQYMLWFLVLAILAEWPAWTYGAMAVAGLIDYVNSMTILHYMYPHSNALGWYAYRLFPVGLAVRYIALLASTIAGIWTTLAVPLTNQKPVAADHMATG